MSDMVMDIAAKERVAFKTLYNIKWKQ
jgi:hypothetical protein